MSAKAARLKWKFLTLYSTQMLTEEQKQLLESFKKQAQEVKDDPDDNEGKYFVEYTERLIEAARAKERQGMINKYKSICTLKYNGDVKYFKPDLIEDFEVWEDVLPQKILDVLLNETEK